MRPKFMWAHWVPAQAPKEVGAGNPKCSRMRGIERGSVIGGE